MNLYVYSDESGVFDYIHNDLYVFAGIIAIGKTEKDELSRKYVSIEKDIINNDSSLKGCELKASILKNSHKRRLFSVLNNYNKFCVVVKQKSILQSIYNDKKTKQRYLDFAYKLAVKRAIERLCSREIISSDEIEYIYFYIDEHSTATDGKYELREAILQEFKYGTHNWTYSTYFKPIIPSLKGIQLSYCNSEKSTLVRASDIIANRIYGLAINEDWDKLNNIPNLNILTLPLENK